MTEDFNPGDVVICVSVDVCDQCTWSGMEPDITINIYYRISDVESPKFWETKPWLFLVGKPRDALHMFCACSFRKIEGTDVEMTRIIKKAIREPETV